MPINDASIPLLVAVAGHRDPDPEPAHLEALRQGFRRAIADIQHEVRDTPLLVLTGLATGADQIAAEVAIELELPVVAVLPMARAEYERDFEKPGELEAFQRLADKAQQVIELPIVAGETAESIRGFGPARDKQYDALAIHFAETAHVVIAFWDGESADKPGGTTRLVRFRLEGTARSQLAHTAPPDPSLTGLNYQIATRRAPKEGAAQVASKLAPAEFALANSAVARPLASVTLLRLKGEPIDLGDRVTRGNDTALRLTSELLAHHQRYNRDLLRLGPVTQKYPLLPAADMPRDPGLVRLARRYDAADALAVRYRDRAHLSLYLLIGIAAGAFVFFEIFSHLWKSLWVLGVYLVLFAGAWAGYLVVSRWRRYDNRYLDYRAMAEALRVQFFWRLAGVRESDGVGPPGFDLPASVADHYLDRQTDELAWVRKATRAASLVPASSAAFAKALPLVRDHWIAHQRDYFASKVSGEGRALAKWQRYMFWATVIGIGIAGLLFLVGLALGDLKRLGRLPLDLVIVAIASAPVVAGFIGYYVERRAYAEHERSYAHMGHAFARALARLESAFPSPAAADAPAAPGEAEEKKARAIVKDLGREALAENGDWLIIHRERPVKPPTH